MTFRDITIKISLTMQYEEGQKEKMVETVYLYLSYWGKTSQLILTGKLIFKEIIYIFLKHDMINH